MENKLPERKPTRMKYHDYGRPGAYFVTICTEDRAEILSTICGKTVVGDDALGEPSFKNSTTSVGDDALGVPTYKNATTPVGDDALGVPTCNNATTSVGDDALCPATR